jgi:hypothetical protein
VENASQHPRIDAWHPLSPTDLAPDLFGLPLPWWIGGGWAIDLFVGGGTRPHADLDIVVLRRHAPVILTDIAHRWRPFSTGRPTDSGLQPWQAAHDVGPESSTNSVWVARRDADTWAFELILADDDAGRWVFRRDRRIGRPVAELGWLTEDGLLVLQPEVQLLFKARDIRPQDQHDFEVALPHLPAGRCTWLADAIDLHLGPRHPWLPPLRSASGAGV